MIELRDARPDDAIQVADLLHLAQGKASIPIHGLGSLELALQFYRWMFARDGTFWSNDMTTVAVDGQKVVGLVACYPNDEQRESRSIRNNAAIREFFGTSGALVEYFRRRQAYSDGTPSFTASRGIYVMNLAVSPDYRRRGVAEMLLNVPDEACLRLGYVCCCLHAEEGNRPARKLFEKRGYSIQASGSGQGCQELCGFGGYLFMVRHPHVVDGGAPVPVLSHDLADLEVPAETVKREGDQTSLSEPPGTQTLGRLVVLRQSDLV